MTGKNQPQYLVRWPDVAAFRLARHHLTDRDQADLVAVCKDVCGVQAQLMSSAQMAFRARMRSITRAEFDSALYDRRTLVRTSCMRQTLHLLPAADFSLYIGALKKSRMAALWRIMSRFSIIPDELQAMNQAVVEALRAGPMSQRQLTAHIRPKVSKRVRAWMDKVWSVFRPAIVEGWICYGPERGAEVTFVRVDHWLPKQKPFAEREAKQILLRRYLAAYGPATQRDFSRWSGIPMSEVQPLWESLEKEFVRVCVEGHQASLLRQDLKHVAKPSRQPVLRLLPGFDPYLLGHAEKEHLVDSSYYKRVYRNQGWISPVVLLDGRAIGTWFCARRGKRLSLKVEPFGKFSPIIRAGIEEEAASWGGFLESPWEIQFGK